MKNKNTWVMVPLSDDVSVIEAESGGFICTTEGYTGGPDEKEAARLISAAPDLYAIMLDVFEASKLRRPIKKATFEAVCEVLRKADGNWR